MIKFRRLRNPNEPNRSQPLKNPPKDDQDLKALTKEWYAKLKAEGFNDIEDVTSAREYIKNWSTRFHFQYTPEEFQEKQEYYEIASNFLHSYDFAWIPGASLVNWCDREIWRLHVEGVPYRKISEELSKNGWKMNKDTVNARVIKLVEIMKTYNFGNSDD